MQFLTTITLAVLSVGASALVIPDTDRATSRLPTISRASSNSTTTTYTIKRYPTTCSDPTVTITQTKAITAPTPGRFSILPYNPSAKNPDALEKRFTPPAGAKIGTIKSKPTPIRTPATGPHRFAVTTSYYSTCRGPRTITRFARPTPVIQKRQKVVTIFRTVTYKGGKPQGAAPTPAPQQPRPQNPTPANPVPAPAVQAPSGGFQQQILKLHNDARARHQVGPLSWDNKLAEFALNHARKCVWGHSSNRSKISSNGKDAGENIATGSDVTGSMKMFMDEEKNYNYATGASKGGVIGHFTQIVWKGSTSVGCAEYDCGKYPQPAGRAWNKYIVCEYSDPGNFGGRYKENVFPPK